MAERGNETMTEWLDIKLDSLSSEERLKLIEEVAETLSPQELLTLRDQIERRRLRKLEEAKSAVLEEMKGRLSELGLTLNDVVPSRRSRKTKQTPRAKYRSPDGEVWSGRGNAPLWLRQLELQGHNRDEYAVTEG